MRVDIVFSENIQMCLPGMLTMQTCLVPAYCQEPMHFCVNPQLLMMIFFSAKISSIASLIGRVCANSQIIIIIIIIIMIMFRTVQ